MKSGAKLLALLGMGAMMGDLKEIDRTIDFSYNRGVKTSRWGAPIFQGRQMRKKKTNKIHRSRMLRKKHK